MTRARHPKPELEEAVRYAQSKGWRFRALGHWGRLFRAQADRGGCQLGVNGMPRNAGAHARQIVRAVDRCPHGPGDPWMKTYEFAIVASGLDLTADDFETKFYDAGCEDATIAFQKGMIIVDFAREAASIEAAIASAVRDVRAAGARIERIEPDPPVSLSDIAARAAMSRAAMSNYASAPRGKDFPAPVARVTTESPLWQWAEVSRWLYHNRRLAREAVIEAGAVRAANDALQADSADIGARIKKTVSDLEVAL